MRASRSLRQCGSHSALPLSMQRTTRCGMHVRSATVGNTSDASHSASREERASGLAPGRHLLGTKSGRTDIRPNSRLLFAPMHRSSRCGRRRRPNDSNRVTPGNRTHPGTRHWVPTRVSALQSQKSDDTRPSGLEPPRGNLPTRPSTSYTDARCCQERPDRPNSARSRTHRTHLEGRVLPRRCHAQTVALARCRSVSEWSCDSR
jgi:hypothetical protein